MGIHGLTKVIADKSPEAITEGDLQKYFGRKIAIDASMSLYQFLIAVRPGEQGTNLVNQTGEATSHLQGLFYRTIRMLSNDLKPFFVFDGPAPALKSAELAKRMKRKKEAEKDLEVAKEEGDAETIKKFHKRTVRITPKHVEEAKRMLRLMGVPILEAPSEAEAQCAAMVKAGKAWATGSEDMDALTLGSVILVRHLTVGASKKMPILEICLTKALEGLGLDMDSFIDFCILLGCDYCETIRGIGPKRALELIIKHKKMETILLKIDKTKYIVPEHFPYQEIREWFKNPVVTDPSTIDLKWSDPDEEGLLEFLVKEKGFSEDRVKSGIAKIKKSRSTTVQGRLTSFFSIVPSEKKTMPKKPIISNKNSKSLSQTGKKMTPIKTQGKKRSLAQPTNKTPTKKRKIKN
eukprot:TRINITY_DN8000_c0_g1_i1.p1 TRINITY_DN8000_c0_g1~~TRINITY_DN8000_c0_g1_i1.p1  ORF type:complete len:406 (-),score=97.92 TRINITY_DN8000_c0_g1_i1:18-1235(-)